MSDTPPFIASSEKIDGGRAGWSASLAPDSRLPEHERTWWAIDVAFFASYMKLDRDETMAYEQTQWSVGQHAQRGNLLRGPLESGLWPITFPDGTTDYAFVVNFWNVQDLREEQRRIEYEDTFNGNTRPHDPDAGRWAGARSHDVFGRERTGVIDFG